MMKLLKNRKGSDLSIASGIIFIFFFTAILITIFNDEFQSGLPEFNTGTLSDDVNNQAENVSAFTVFEVLKTILKLAFWDFGSTLGLPFWLQAIYTVLAIILIAIIVTSVLPGGG